MNFAFTEEQEALRELARKLIADHATPERLKAVERQPEWLDRTLWEALAQTNLLGVALPEEAGGSGLGIVELCILLEEVGRAVAPVPVWPALVLGALPIAEFGTAAQRRQWLPGVVRGDTMLTAALVETGWDDPLEVATTARPAGTGWRLDGTKVCVPAAHLAARVVVPAQTADGLGIFLLDPKGPGVILEPGVGTSGEPQFRLSLDGAGVGEGDILGGPADGSRILDWLLQRATLGLCALQAGVADRALRLTAEYTSKREQFGKPLATFQAVGQRAADAYIDVEAIRWTMWQAAWRLSAGRPATEEVAIAKFWAAEAGHRVVYAAQHLHGGIGLDVDYPLHRYFLWSKQLELGLGSATRQLEALGELLEDA